VVLGRALRVATAYAIEGAGILTETIDASLFVCTAAIISAADHTSIVFANQTIAAVAIILAFANVAQRSTLHRRITNEAIFARANRSV